MVGPFRPDRIIDRTALLVGMVAHGNVVGVVGEGDLWCRQAMGILELGVEFDPVAFLRHILADDPHTRHMRVVVHLGGKVAPPVTWLQKRRHKWQAKGQGLKLIAADEPTGRIMPALIGYDAGHGGSSEHVHRLFETGIDRAGHVTHIVLADLPR